MNIGYFTNRHFENEQGDNIEFIGGTLNIPFVGIQNLILQPTSQDELAKNPKLPLYKFQAYKPKGWQGSAQIIGGVWEAISKDGKTRYLKGYIESPIFSGGKLYLALFTPQEQSNVLFEANWSAPIKQNQLSTGGYNNIDSDISQYADHDYNPF